ncbi:MAG TPA: hypothetical protein VGM30_19790 [Puia sp.]|jgi:hypothetical protein
MEKMIFYSWQSDLPTNKNRGFIQDCLEKSVKKLQNQHVHLEIAIDRDTQGVIGTPDIASTIFSKIEQANVFVADISFINPNTTGRKTPNPNVLIELGFAAKSIGWENVLCIFNEEYGKMEDLPFDLRLRRPIPYRIASADNKVNERKELSARLQAAINEIIRKQSAKDEVRNFLKAKIDKEVLAICGNIFKIVHGYDGESFSNENIWEFLQLTQIDLNNKLSNRQFIGFTVLKDWQDSKDHLTSTINEPFFVQHAHESYTHLLVRIIRNLSLLESITEKNKVFKNASKRLEGYKAVDGQIINPNNPVNQYLLFKIITSNEGVVTDFGNFQPYNKDRLLLFQDPDEHYPRFVVALHNLLASLHNWIKSTDNNIIITF